MKRNQSLDGLRGIAVLTVFLYHTLGVPAAGHLGVDVFFVLSGYLITGKLIEELDSTGTIDIRRFYVNRCLRLIPAFIVMCVIAEGMHYCFPDFVSLAPPGMLLVFLFTSNIYWMHGLQPYPIVSHIWTLATEWQFYLAWPLIASIALRRRRTAVAVALVAGGIALMLAELKGLKVPKFEGIMIGAALSIALSRANGKSLPLQGVPVTLAGVACLIALAFAPPVNAEISSAIAVTLAAIIIYAAASPGASNVPVLGGPVLRYFGKISYGLYIYHFPVVAVTYVALQPPMHMFMIALVVSIPLSDFSFRFIEEPAMKLRRLLRNDRSAVAIHQVPAGYGGSAGNGSDVSPVDAPTNARSARRQLT